MTSLSDFKITTKWPAKYPDRLQLYSRPTPNGAKVSIMLEEIGLPYEPHPISFAEQDQKSPEFLSLNPNNKVPAIIDPNGPDGRPVPLFESGAILVYLADKTGQLLPSDSVQKYQTLQWLAFQSSGIAPMFGQIGFFYKFAGRDYEDKRPLERYVTESQRLLGVLDRQLESQEWVVGNDYTIADISIFPWVNNLLEFYDAGDLVGFSEFRNVNRALTAFLDREAVKRGLEIPPRI